MEWRIEEREPWIGGVLSGFGSRGLEEEGRRQEGREMGPIQVE